MTNAPCYGLHELFDSTHPEAHKRAAAICAACPLLQTCRGELYAVRAEYGLSATCGPRGTWAGMLIDPDPSTRRQSKCPPLGACGTAWGQREHRRLRTPVCEPCRVAFNAYKRDWYRRQKEAR